jgi:hypothetical protein
MAVNLVVNTVAIRLERIGKMAPRDRVPFFSWYRVFGLLLCLARILVAIDSIVFSKYYKRLTTGAMKRRLSPAMPMPRLRALLPPSFLLLGRVYAQILLKLMYTNTRR